MIDVKPDILVWARETAGLELDEAARKLGFTDSKRSTASQKLHLLESGEKHPTRPQLYKMSKTYHQPLIAFYLPMPPRDGDYGEDFRSAASREFDRKGEARLRLLMRNVKASQNIMRNLLEEEGEAQTMSFVNSANVAMGADNLAEAIVKTLGFDRRTFREQKTVGDAFAFLRERIERLGIFVLLQSDLGSHHTTIPVEVFRGFVFADDLAPYIVINRNDAVSAWAFTALHELAHLWLGNSGISGAWGDADIERFCDRVAATVLLPPVELRKLPPLRAATLYEAAAAIGDFATPRNISRSMVAYNLAQADKITWTQWRALRDRFAEDWAKQKEVETTRSREREGGPSYYVVRRFHLGTRLIGMARYFVSGGELTPSKAGVVLGVNAAKVYTLLYPERSGA